MEKETAQQIIHDIRGTFVSEEGKRTLAILREFCLANPEQTCFCEDSPEKTAYNLGANSVFKLLDVVVNSNNHDSLVMTVQKLFQRSNIHNRFIPVYKETSHE